MPRRSLSRVRRYGRHRRHEQPTTFSSMIISLDRISPRMQDVSAYQTLEGDNIVTAPTISAGAVGTACLTLPQFPRHGEFVSMKVAASISFEGGCAVLTYPPSVSCYYRVASSRCPHTVLDLPRFFAYSTIQLKSRNTSSARTQPRLVAVENSLSSNSRRYRIPPTGDNQRSPCTASGYRLFYFAGGSRASFTTSRRHGTIDFVHSDFIAAGSSPP